MITLQLTCFASSPVLCGGHLSFAISVTEALRPAKRHENRATIAAAGSGKVERLLERSRPYICLIWSVRVGRISGRLCLLWER
jgi:hypothetical protein